MSRAMRIAEEFAKYVKPYAKGKADGDAIEGRRVLKSTIGSMRDAKMGGDFCKNL